MKDYLSVREGLPHADQRPTICLNEEDVKCILSTALLVTFLLPLHHLLFEGRGYLMVSRGYHKGITSHTLGVTWVLHQFPMGIKSQLRGYDFSDVSYRCGFLEALEHDDAQATAAAWLKILMPQCQTRYTANQIPCHRERFVHFQATTARVVVGVC